ncbi:MAG TPA: hypothetical protein VIN36_10425 [Thiobacillus sp.]
MKATTVKQRKRGLTDDQVIWMRQQFRQGWEGKALAAQLGVSKTTAMQAIRGISYRHLPDPVLLGEQVVKPLIVRERKPTVEKRPTWSRLHVERACDTAFMQWAGGEPRQDWRVRL